MENSEHSRKYERSGDKELDKEQRQGAENGRLVTEDGKQGTET